MKIKIKIQMNFLLMIIYWIRCWGWVIERNILINFEVKNERIIESIQVTKSNKYNKKEYVIDHDK